MTKCPIFADECIPKDLVAELRESGYTVFTVVEEKLSGVTDEIVFQYALKKKWVLLTFDRGFGDIFRFNYQGTAGTVVMLIRGMSKEEVKSVATSFFETYKDLQGKLVIIGRKKIRVVER